MGQFNIQSTVLWAIGTTIALVQLAPGSAIATSSTQNRFTQAITVKIETNNSVGSDVLIHTMNLQDIN
jgi:hypothetical protein